MRSPALLMRFLLAAITMVVVAAPLPCRAQSDAKIVTYPAPQGIPLNRDFTVKVRTPGGPWTELSIYEVQVDMHHPRPSSMAYFDFSGKAEVSVTYNRGTVRAARLRPLSYGITPTTTGNIIAFTLDQPRNLSVEINDDIFGNLHLFAGPVEINPPDPRNPDVIYFAPGIHDPGPTLRIPTGKTVYLAGGAVVRTKLLCDRVESVRILGRGILYQPERGIEITFSKDVLVDGIIVVNPTHYTVYGGGSRSISIRNLKSFSSKGWSDGIDLMSCSDVLVSGVFLRNSDDCIALYGHRWNFFGDTTDIVVRNSCLWADVAHPINIGTHGNAAKPETLENLTFSNLDILNHDEPQVSYQGCMAINVSDENLARNIRFENIRVEDFEQGQLVNLRVAFNRKYAAAPGRGIENVTFKDITYNGSRANISVITGYDDSRPIMGVVFDNLKINGQVIRTADAARFFIGEHVEGVEFRTPQP